MRNPAFLQRVNPNFFYDYAKMFGERSQKNQNNVVERMLNVSEKQLKENTYNEIILEELENDMKKFLSFSRGKAL